MNYKKDYYIKLTLVNLITAVRFIGAFILPILSYKYGAIKTAIIVFIIFSTDAVDGKLSRLWSVQTFFGALLDGICDKIFAISCLGILALYNKIMFIPLILEIIIVLVNTIAYRDNLNVQSTKIGKRKTIILGATIVIGFLIISNSLYIEYMPTQIANIITNNTGIITLLTGFITGMQCIVLLDYSKRTFAKETKKIIQTKTKISNKELINLLFDTKLYTKNKDLPLRELMYK